MFVLNAMTVNRKLVSIARMSDEDFAIATRSKSALLMVIFDHADEDDMLTYLMYRKAEMPKAGLANGITALIQRQNELMAQELQKMATSMGLIQPAPKPTLQ